MTLIVAGERSGVGKTTVTLALLAYLRQQGDRVQSFKVGPDYIDPMFHRWVTGRACRTLDPVLTSETYVQRCYAHHTSGVAYSLIEGVMGLFDGASGRRDVASTAHIARLLKVPVLLVLDCARLSRSVAAIAHGYRSFDPAVQIAGVVLNRVGSDRHLTLLKEALEPLHLPILGVLRRQDEITLPDRHLGLVPTDELPQLQTILDRLADLAATSFDWSRLRPLLTVDPSDQAVAHTADLTPPPGDPPSATRLSSPVRLAVARDRAFSFYYDDNLDSLTTLGAELLYWSPLEDATLPDGTQGLYFGGGFPEMFAAELAENAAALHQVRQAIAAGMPTYAECGGLMYLSRAIQDFEGREWPMVGLLPTTTIMGDRLTLGYRCATVQQSGPLLPAGATLWGHEFHRSHTTDPPTAPLYHLRGYEAQAPLPPEGWQNHNLQASYVHLHWGSRPDLPIRFLQHCAAFDPVVAWGS